MSASGVCGGDKKRFVLRRRDEDAAAEHFLKEYGKTGGVGFFCVRIIANRLVGKKDSKQRTRDIHVTLHVCIFRAMRNPSARRCVLRFTPS